MKLINTSVNRPVGVIIIVIAVMLLGALSLRNLAIDLLPDIRLPVAVVTTGYQGAGPQEVENLVTRPIEGAMSRLEGIDTIQSLSVANQSVVFMMFNFGTNMETAMLDAREQVDMVSALLPEGSADPMVLRFDPNAMPILQLSVSGDASLTDITTWTEDVLQPELERLPGVGQVSLSGDEIREIQVVVDPDQMQHYGLRMNDLIQLLAASNQNASAGTISRGPQEMTLRLIGEFESVEEIGELKLFSPRGEIFSLADVATIQDTMQEQTSYALVDGFPTVSVDVIKQSDANIVDVARQVNAEVVKLQGETPAGMQIDMIMDTSIFIEDSIESVIVNMVIGGAMAALILLLFLRSFRTTLIVIISIPIALISAFVLIYFSGETLNMLTMGGLALGVGLIIDNSIIILENIFKFRERGYGLVEAAKKGASEISGAVIAATLTSVVVFLPIVFTSGIASEIFMPLAITVSFTLLASLAVALTVVPMLAARMLHHPEVAEKPGRLRRLGQAFGHGVDALLRLYRPILQWAITHRKTVLVLVLILFVASLAVVPLVGSEFIPSFDQGELRIEVELLAGSSLDETKEVLAQLERLLEPYQDDIEMLFTNVGSSQQMGGMGGGGSNVGNIYLRLVPATERNFTTNDVIETLTDYEHQLPDVSLQAQSLQSVDMGDAPLVVDILGDDLDQLEELANEVQQIVLDVPGTLNVEHSLEETLPELQVKVNRERAAAYGLIVPEILNSVRTAFTGQVATYMRDQGQEVQVRLIMPEEKRNSIQALQDMMLSTPTGEQVPLEMVADFVRAEGPPSISRQNQMRGVSVTGEIIDRDLDAVIADVEQRLNHEISPIMPEGYSYQFGGEFEQMEDAFADLQLALMLAVFLIYAVMAVQFEKVLFPFIVLFCLPMSFIGVMFGFVVTGIPLSVPAYIGLIMLAGIVVNNGIVLIDYINLLRSRGMERDQAIMEAGPGRLRPILMTMLTTVLAMLPLSLGIGEGAELQMPLAMVIVFGLSFSTFITLVLLPVIYIFMDNLTNWFTGLFRKKKAVEQR